MDEVIVSYSAVDLYFAVKESISQTMSSLNQKWTFSVPFVEVSPYKSDCFENKKCTGLLNWKEGTGIKLHQRRG